MSAAPLPGQEVTRRPLGVLAALPQELGDLLGAMRAESGVRTVTHGQRDYHVGTVHGTPCVVTLARVGKVAAAATVSALIHVFDVREVVFAGVAGGVGKDVRIGDIVIADTLLQHDLDASPLFPRFEVPLLGIARFAADRSLASRFPQSPAAQGKASRSLITFVRDRPGHDRRYAIEPAKISGELGFAPSRDLATGLKQTIDWYIAEEAWWRSVRTGAYRDWMKSHYGWND